VCVLDTANQIVSITTASIIRVVLITVPLLTLTFTEAQTAIMRGSRYVIESSFQKRWFVQPAQIFFVFLTVRFTSH